MTDYEQGSSSLNRKRLISDVKSSPKGTGAAVVAQLISLRPDVVLSIDIPRQKLVTVGRSRKNDIVLSELDCSVNHCEIVMANLANRDVIYLRDLSSNGTFINDVIIGKGNTVVLRTGDRVSFAQNSHFLIKYNGNDGAQDLNSIVSSMTSPEKKRARAHRSFYDEYVLGNLLGAGHYAQVKEAIRKNDGLVCAVKIFNPTRADDLNNSKASNFNRELDILMKVDHVNIVKFHETFLEPVDQNTITTYLVLEKVNGGELFNRIVDKRFLREVETKALIMQLLRGLEYLHDIDIAHRDLKPENILLSITPRNNMSQLQTGPWDEHELDIQVKIADFGLAKFIGEYTYTNTLCGTPAYVAPEVLVNGDKRQYNKAVDMWSVGVLIYVCLCGFPPFSDELGPPSMRQQIIEGKFAFFSPYWDNIDDRALDLVVRLLVTDPGRRHTVKQTINHLWFHDLPTIYDNNMEMSTGDDNNKMTYETGLVAPVELQRVPTRADSNPVMLQDRVLAGAARDNTSMDVDS